MLTIPESRAEAGSDADEVAARTRVEAVVFAILDMGVPARDVLFSGLVSAQAPGYELRIFPVRICREQAAHRRAPGGSVAGAAVPREPFGAASPSASSTSDLVARSSKRVNLGFRK